MFLFNDVERAGREILLHSSVVRRTTYSIYLGKSPGWVSQKHRKLKMIVE